MGIDSACIAIVMPGHCSSLLEVVQGPVLLWDHTILYWTNKSSTNLVCMMVKFMRTSMINVVINLCKQSVNSHLKARISLSHCITRVTECDSETSMMVKLVISLCK